MHCYDPDEQIFQVEDKLIAIDWSKNGDKAIKVTSRIEKDGTITVLGFEELNK